MADYAGIIVTSPRSGDTLGEMFAADRALLQKWKQKPVVCIGDRTASALVRAGLEPVVAERASSEGVADQVAGLNRVGKWLFLCGSLRRDELPLSLIRAGMAFEELVIYHTLPQEHINLNRLETPDWVVFFSPSGVDAVRKIWPERWKHVQKAAIGNATASAIDAAGWKVDTVAEKPEASSLLEAVSQQV